MGGLALLLSSSKLMMTDRYLDRRCPIHRYSILHYRVRFVIGHYWHDRWSVRVDCDLLIRLFGTVERLQYATFGLGIPIIGFAPYALGAR